MISLLKFITASILVLSLNSHAQVTQTVSLKVSDKTEQLAVDNASQAEIKQLVECVIAHEVTNLEETSCINEVFGDVHN